MEYVEKEKGGRESLGPSSLTSFLHTTLSTWLEKKTCWRPPFFCSHHYLSRGRSTKNTPNL